MLLGVSSYSNILLSSLEAFSGNTIGSDFLEDTNHFHIPGLIGNLVAFNINGNSMSPTIKMGDMVICKPLENFTELKENGIYAVVTNQSIWVKRVQKFYDESGQWTQLKLISDNFNEFDPFLVSLEEVKKLLRVKHRLTRLESY